MSKFCVSQLVAPCNLKNMTYIFTSPIICTLSFKIDIKKLHVEFHRKIVFVDKLCSKKHLFASALSNIYLDIINKNSRIT